MRLGDPTRSPTSSSSWSPAAKQAAATAAASTVSPAATPTACSRTWRSATCAWSTRRRIAAFDIGPEDLRNEPQDHVARLMAIGVVEFLEMIDVHHDEGQRRVVARRLHRRTPQYDVELLAIGDAGQRVGQRLLAPDLAILAQRIHLRGGIQQPGLAQTRHAAY